MTPPRRVLVVVYDDSELLEIAAVTTAFAVANSLGADPPYRSEVIGRGGRPVRAQSGLVLNVQAALERTTGACDTLLVVGGLGHHRAADDEQLVGHVRRLARHSARVAAVCTGSTVLAAAGLLDGRRAATHWSFADDLAARHPRVRVDPAPVYIRDGNVATSAGVTCALDLTLAFVGEDHGPTLARDVARMMVTYLHRPGDQAQMSMHVAAPAPADPVVRRVLDHVVTNLDTDLSTPALAAVGGVSERHLLRLFDADLGVSPGTHVRRTRVEAAAQLLVGSTLAVSRIAVRCGFGSAEVLRQAFVARYGVSPTLYRRTQSVTPEPRRSAG